MTTFIDDVMICANCGKLVGQHRLGGTHTWSAPAARMTLRRVIFVLIDTRPSPGTAALVMFCRALRERGAMGHAIPDTTDGSLRETVSGRGKT
jgi:hypothetical protein